MSDPWRVMRNALYGAMDMTRRKMLAVSGSALAGPSLAYGQTQSASPQALTYKNGTELPAIGMGSWLTFNIDPEGPEMASRKKVLEAFFAAGGGMIDSSPMYGTAQGVIGKLLTELSRPKTAFSATKIWTSSKRLGSPQLKASRQLWEIPNATALDLMHVHNLLNWEDHLPMLNDAKTRGDIRYVGLTTSHGRRHAEMEHLIQAESVDAVQFTYNLTHRIAENRLLPAALELGVPVIINRPFDGGALFDQFDKHPLPDFAAEIDCQNWAQFFLKFVISHPGVSVAIPATSNPLHMMENMGASKGALPDAEMRKRMITYAENL